jgi:GGDEF domain-containing protein
MTYASSRRLILAGGIVVLVLLAAVLFARRVDTIEVAAVLLFIPVFLGAVIWGLPGGLVTGVLASVAYGALRSDAIDALGATRFAGIITSRTFGYIAFGVIAGWAVQQLERSLEKLDIYDQIDDETGLYNARYFLQQTDLEMARASRYKTLFSVVTVDLPASAIEALGRRRRNAVISDLGRALESAVRTVDSAVHANHGEVHRFAVICPETAKEGAAVFRSRLAEQLAVFLGGRGVTITAEALSPRDYTVPGDEHELSRLRAEFERIELEEHPENARSA